MDLVTFIAFAKLRSHFSLPLVGEDETLDDQLGRAIYQYLNLGVTEAKPEESERQYLQCLLDDVPSNSDREMYFRVRYWLNFHTDQAEEIANTYKLIFSKEIVPIDEGEIQPLFKNTRQRFRHQTRSLRESKARLIKLSLKDLNLLLPWISLCFVFSGYIYTSILYGGLGISSGQFFSISDYISSSISQLPHAIYGAVAYIVGVLYSYRNLPTETIRERQKYARFGRWYSRLFFLSCSGLLIAMYLKSLFFPIIPLLAIGVSQPIIGYISSKFFRHSLPVFIGAMFLLIFFVSIFASARQEIDDIKSGKADMQFKVELGDKVYKVYTEEDATVIGSNSRYMFLYMADDTVEVIPLDKIDKISLNWKTE